MSLDFDNLETYAFDLPESLIAQRPLEKRDHSRLLLVNKAEQSFEDHFFYDLPTFLRKNDLLVFNDTRVRHGRLHGRVNTRNVEIFLLEKEGDGWKCLVKPGKLFRKARAVQLPHDLYAHYQRRDGEIFYFTFSKTKDPPAQEDLIPRDAFERYLEKHAQVPLPPYIREPLSKKERYQTIYSNRTGSSAAPTAGLHFTRELLNETKKKGVEQATLELKIGLDTFQPVRTSDLSQHTMHAESYCMDAAAERQLNKAHEEGRRIIAIGTTSLRALEANYLKHGRFYATATKTRLFLRPPSTVHSTNGLLTNFHLPKSTLLMLVSAFAGYELTKAAYAHAIRKSYRFFSFGDAMLIL